MKRNDLRIIGCRATASIVFAAGLALSLSACGDDVTEVNELRQDGFAVLEKGKKLSAETCDTTNVGDVLFVKDSSAAFVCDGDAWVSMMGADGKDGLDGKDGEDGKDGLDGKDGDAGASCEIKAIKDGYKILCGGDSVGVVKNGENGKPGEAGASCGVAPIKDGYKVVCDGDSVGVVKNGENGNPGDAGKSAYELSGSELPEEEWLKSLKGDSGVSCEAEIAKNAGGLTGIEVSCGGIVVDTIWNGDDGENGSSAYEIAVKRGFKGSEDEWMERLAYPNLWDKRDGKIYRTVRIGSQVWMAENLNYEYIPESDEDIGESWCFDDNEENCDKYGRLYNWAAANEVCPEGWHLPNNKDWDVLLRSVATDVWDRENGQNYYYGAETKLKVTGNWYYLDSLDSVYVVSNGEDSYGFSILPAGTRSGTGFYNMYMDAFLWTSTEIDDDLAIMVVVLAQADAIILKDDRKGYSHSVRCLKGIIKEN